MATTLTSTRLLPGFALPLLALLSPLLCAQTRPITGEVRNHDGSPAKGVRVEVVEPGNKVIGWDTTDQGGNYSIRVPLAPCQSMVPDESCRVQVQDFEPNNLRALAYFHLNPGLNTPRIINLKFTTGFILAQKDPYPDNAVENASAHPTAPTTGRPTATQSATNGLTAGRTPTGQSKVPRDQATATHADTPLIRQRSDPKPPPTIRQLPPSTDATVFEWDTSIPASLRDTSSFKLNGQDVRSSAPAANSTTFLGGTPEIGLNVIESVRAKYLVWREAHKLMVFENPYANSYAVIVAIDDYERRYDPKRRGPTGFGQLGSMVAKAQELRAALVVRGFSPERIITLYNQQAESSAITDVLRSFWQGGKRSDADRLFFYFGGHGSHLNGEGLLITYDYDAKSPTLSSFLMHDLTGQQSENIIAKHVFFALDACDSGLALPTLGDDFQSLSELKTFRSLSIIRNDTTPTSRNILLAGTGKQAAIYDNGGIFTEALVLGLSGQADTNGDGIIEASELANFVKDEVAFMASQKGFVQQVGFYKLTAYGTGEVIFFKKSQH